MKKTIIIEENAQFGRASTSATYCYDLVDLYNFIYICYDQGQPKITPPSSTKVIYVEKKNRVYKKIKLIQEIVNAAYKTSNSVLYLSYFRGVSLVRILVPFRKVIVDYRTGCVNSNKWNRFLKNLLMTFEALFFRHKVVISIDLKQHLHLANNTKILPIGANILSSTNKQFDKLRLLYVGTLAVQRDVYKTIEGVVEFREKRPNADLRYDIIGKGNGMNHIKAEIQRFSAGDYIKVHGYVPGEEITPFYDNCNVGVCFARMEDYYLVQPFTKLYEYGLSGMALISVKVKDSVRRIDEKLGVLCDDNADSFADALVQL
ncbi:MAG: glycosyltransferase family 4 protein, partial [Clostridiaceae bacterium]|nr:glycosyltransferase family 4 protein [Clostridiaceae bacterium]